MYFIYTNRDILEGDGNWDHVIPLSLGGRNQFVVWSDKAANSRLGSAVDGAVHKDPLLAFALRNAGVTGHRGKPVEPIWRRTQIDGRPCQITWGKDNVTAWDVRARRKLDDSELGGKPIDTHLTFNLHAGIRLLAKVALGGGHYVYGVRFSKAVDCRPLRELALLDIEGARQEASLLNSGISVCDRFHPDAQSGGAAYMNRLLCEHLHRSVFLAVPHGNAISFHVGIVGAYVGSLLVPAETADLPLDGDHDLGHAVILAPGEMERCSYREMARSFYNYRWPAKATGV